MSEAVSERPSSSVRGAPCGNSRRERREPARLRGRLVRLGALASLSLYAAGCAAPLTVLPETAPLESDVDPETTGIEGEAHGFPALRSLDGQTLANGEFTQWLEGDRLHLKIRYDFGPARWIEETSVLQQEPRLVQERWSWLEVRSGMVERRFEVDFLAQNATAEKLDGNELQRWTEHVDIEPGRAFAGAAWALAIKSVRPRLMRGEAIQFQTVGFTPKPRAATVEISHDSLDQLPMAGRTLSGDRFRIHAKIPWPLRMFADVPDSQIWLASSTPAAFLRWEGPLAEPGDPLVRVDLLSGDPSGAAMPATPQAPPIGPPAQN